MLAELLYYSLTTGSGAQTLGEEYCDILQVSGLLAPPLLPVNTSYPLPASKLFTLSPNTMRFSR